MLVILSLFALGASGNNPDEMCYGKTIKDYAGCALMAGNGDACLKDPNCNFGMSPARIMAQNMEQCMKDAGKTMFSKCTWNGDCARQCGSLCINGACSGCMDMGIKEDCDLAVEKGLKCKWSGDDNDGACLDMANCYGKNLHDHAKCAKYGYDSVECLKDPDCEFGMDPIAMRHDDYKTCARDGDFLGKKCSSKDDCTMCSTGQMCLDKGRKKICAGCFDMGRREDCELGKEAGLKCKWSRASPPGEGNDGICIPSDSTPVPVSEPTSTPTEMESVDPTMTPTQEVTPSPTDVEEDDECADLKKGPCKKSPLCDYAFKKCVRNYEPECVGNKVDIHHKCFGVKTKEECDAVKQGIFAKSVCHWGKNTIDMDSETKKCLEKKVGAPMKCDKNDDCMCGQLCYEMFSMKSCSTCRDMGIKEDCDAMTLGSNKKIACKWVGGEDDGICIQVDPCREFSEDENRCKTERNKTCQFKDERCSSMKADKKTCKKRGKDKKATLAKNGAECVALKGCKWSEKKGKGKCKAGN